MAVWVIVDNSTGTDELLVGAGAAAVAAILIEIASHQAETRFGVRIRWLARAASLPGQVAGDTFIVFAALGRCLLTGARPRSGFITRPVNPGPDTPDGRLHRALIIGAESLAPNRFVLGIDADRGVMVVHKLVLDPGDEPE